MKYSDAYLRQLQNTMLEILQVYDAFCRQHNLKYSLYAGTLLGAVRHNGFIPWDDDVDVCMERNEYDRFVELWLQHPVKGYLLQNKEIDNNFTQTFTKIRKRNTTFLQHEEERGKIHTGIFLDIFPLDRMPKSFFKRKIYQFHALLNLLFTREFIPEKANIFEKIISAMVLKMTNRKIRSIFRGLLLRKIKFYNNINEPYDIVSATTLNSILKPYPKEFWNGTMLMMSFEQNLFPCTSGWEIGLKTQFGNYMVLPPANERVWKHHPIELDFSKEIQK